MKIKSTLEVVEASVAIAKTKADAPLKKLLICGILAGAFIAFAAEASNMAAFNLLASPDTYGLGRLVAGAVFPAGLMFVILTGCELFTGNCLMVAPLVRREIRAGAMLRNWGWVYLFNLIGSLIVVFLIFGSGQLHGGDELLGAMTVKIAVNKTGYSFASAFFLGIMCNWLVGLAVWLSWSTESIGGKIAGIFFPIFIFITSGFEHCIANMYYIPAGIMAKSVPAIADKALEIGISQEALLNLNWGSFFVSNLIPVTAGNIVGAAVFVALAYYFATKTEKKSI